MYVASPCSAYQMNYLSLLYLTYVHLPFIGRSFNLAKLTLHTGNLLLFITHNADTQRYNMVPLTLHLPKKLCYLTVNVLAHFFNLII